MEVNSKNATDDNTSKTKVFDIHLMKLIREIIFISQPLVNENIKMGIALYEFDKKVICALINRKNFFQIKFPFGYQLRDSRNLLRGKHKFHKHINVYNRDQIDPFIIYDFIKQSSNLVVAR